MPRGNEASDRSCVGSLILPKDITDNYPSRFPCEHIFHMQCIRQLEAHARDLSKPLECPTCRKACEIDDIVNVSRTAGEQWKELTDVATEWAMMDGEPDEAETEYVCGRYNHAEMDK